MNNYKSTSKCPVSGLPIIQKPEWIDINLNEKYKITFSFIGENILLMQPTGYATKTDLQKVVSLAKEVVDEVIPKDHPLIVIQDYKNLTGATYEARKYFINYYKTYERILAVVFINTPVLMEISVKLAKRLHIFPYNIYMAKDYQEAIQLSLEFLSKNSVVKKEIPDQYSEEYKITAVIENQQQEKIPEVISRDEWRLDTEDYSVRYEYIDGDIFHSISSGYLEEKHIPAFRDLYERIDRDTRHTGDYYVIVGMDNLKRMSFRARKAYFSAVKEWYARKPFQLCVVYGANRFMQTVINLSRPLRPYKVRVEDDFESAKRYIDEYKIKKRESLFEKDQKSPEKQNDKIGEIHSYVDQLLQFLGGIDWESEKPVDLELIPGSSHPFRPVYDAVSIIKEDIDKLFQDMKSVVEDLGQSEARYRNIISNISDFIFFHDLNGIFMETNVHLNTDWGFTEEDVTNLDIRKIVPEKYRSQFEGYLHRVISNGHDEGFMQIQIKDGSKRIIEYKNDLIYDSNGQPMGVQGFAKDVTEKIKSERALKESEEKYRNILQNIEEGYYEVDLAGNMVFFNDAVLKDLGYSRDELTDMTYKKYILPEYLDKVRKIYNQVYKTGKPLGNVQYKTITKKGEIHVIEASVLLMKNSKGEPIGFRGISRDVTDKIQAEEEKRRLEDKLQQAKRMEAIGMLAGGVAHDLNNILSGLVSYPELLLLDLPKDSPFRKPVETMKSSGEKAATIVQDLLALARRGVTETETVNINQIVMKYLESPEHQRIMSYHPHVSIETRLDPELLNVSGSLVHLMKAIMNLVSNAAEAMPGAGNIIISTENRHLDTIHKGDETRKEGDYVVLTVTDSGVGISEKDIRRIFEPFYTKKIMGRSGTGLGMAVVWGTVKDHEGFIDVKSVEGEGTEISLFFQATREETVQELVSPSMDRYKSKGEKILVVDDVIEQREIATMMLKTLGYEVDVVSSGEEAVEYIRTHRVDLIILDMIMEPGIDGLETYRRITGFNPGQKAIIASGFSETGRVKEVKKLGANAYIRKPYLLEKIGKAVRQELEKE